MDFSKLPINEFKLGAVSAHDKISENFTLHELVRSDIATRRGIKNQFVTDKQLQNAVYLCRNILEPIRINFGSFTPNSVYRSHAVERVLKGRPQSWVSRSQHTRGEAADIEIPGLRNLELAHWINKHLKFDQLILEMYTPGEPKSGWVHVSLCRDRNREQVLSYIKQNGVYIYAPGIAISES